MSPPLRKLGMRLAKREGIVPLRRGQARPVGYYTGNHATGESRIPRGAVVPADEPPVGADRRNSLRELGMRLAKREELVPLRPGQARPVGYYTGNHATGESRIPRGAVVPADEPAVGAQPTEQP